MSAQAQTIGMLVEDARALLDETGQLRRRIHRHPELALHLPRTQQAVLEALEGLGLAIRTGHRYLGGR